MHAALWKFGGDPDDLLARYDAMLAEVGAGGMQLHACLRAPDGIVMLDSYPDRDAFGAFARSEGFRALRERHGLPEPVRIDDYPVHVAYAGGAVIHTAGPPPIRADPPDEF